MGKWWEFIDNGPKRVAPVRIIPVRFLGIQKAVVVRTRKNGGIRVTPIQVKVLP